MGFGLRARYLPRGPAQLLVSRRVITRCEPPELAGGSPARRGSYRCSAGTGGCYALLKIRCVIGDSASGSSGCTRASCGRSSGGTRLFRLRRSWATSQLPLWLLFVLSVCLRSLWLLRSGLLHRRRLYRRWALVQLLRPWILRGRLLRQRLLRQRLLRGRWIRLRTRILSSTGIRVWKRLPRRKWRGIPWRPQRLEWRPQQLGRT